ncbi:hypothetical protein OS188_03220 [Xanthomarina sp. F1114]|uniref:DUF4870 domain-containing protein n=1 Tax=Xanthomarina sp. F1114 TaxID=2996019 RepID=UPI00225E60AC|nr:hypothetical protein [Xanthomarina sp. F1114]MCX7546958.1 hypothetical protein [Xanthomarina sp. F1114]
MESIENTTTAENTTRISEGKNIATIAYLTVIGLIIAFVLNNDKKNQFASFHIKQSLGLALTGFALGVIGLIPIIGWLINIIGIFVLIYMWIMGLMNAINGNKKMVPILGNKYSEWFKNL